VPDLQCEHLRDEKMFSECAQRYITWGSILAHEPVIGAYLLDALKSKHSDKIAELFARGLRLEVFTEELESLLFLFGGKDGLSAERHLDGATSYLRSILNAPPRYTFCSLKRACRLFAKEVTETVLAKPEIQDLADLKLAEYSRTFIENFSALSAITSPNPDETEVARFGAETARAMQGFLTIARTVKKAGHTSIFGNCNKEGELYALQYILRSDTGAREIDIPCPSEISSELYPDGFGRLGPQFTLQDMLKVRSFALQGLETQLSWSLPNGSRYHYRLPELDLVKKMIRYNTILSSTDNHSRILYTRSMLADLLLNPAAAQAVYALPGAALSNIALDILHNQNGNSPSLS
jgi:hypothetical protein